MLFFKSVGQDGPSMCQDHLAGRRKEPCYPKSSHSVSVIREAMGPHQRRWMPHLLLVGWLASCSKLLSHMVSWLNLNLSLIRSNCREKPVYPCVPTFNSPRCQQRNWTFGGSEGLYLIIRWALYFQDDLRLPELNTNLSCVGSGQQHYNTNEKK